jgi:putative redox protein
LLVHGSADDVVPVEDARMLADAAGKHVELRIVANGPHRLRHDPRAIAALLGWLDHQMVEPAPGAPGVDPETRTLATDTP